MEKVIKMSMAESERQEILAQVGVTNGGRRQKHPPDMNLGVNFEKTFDFLHAAFAAAEPLADNPSYSISTTICRGLAQAVEEVEGWNNPSWVVRLLLMMEVLLHRDRELAKAVKAMQESRAECPFDVVWLAFDTELAKFLDKFLDKFAPCAERKDSKMS